MFLKPRRFIGQSQAKPEVQADDDVLHNNLHTQLKRNISTNNVEILTSPQTLERETHHVNDIDKEEGHAQHHGREDLDFSGIRQIKPR
jgi:hypothetical protein